MPSSERIVHILRKKSNELASVLWESRGWIPLIVVLKFVIANTIRAKSTGVFKEMGHRVKQAIATQEENPYEYLTQRIAVAVQRGDAASAGLQQAVLYWSGQEMGVVI